MNICHKGGVFVPLIETTIGKEPVEVSEEVGKILLRNPDFYEYKGNKEAKKIVSTKSLDYGVKVEEKGKSFKKVTYEEG